MNNLVATKRRLAVHVTQLEKLSCGATVLKVKNVSLQPRLTITVTLKQVDTVCCGENDKEVHDIVSVSVLVVILYNLNL